MGYSTGRGRRPAETYDQQVLTRLYHATGDGRRPAMAFGEICDRMRIPRHRRAGLLTDLVEQHLITREGGWVGLTEEGKARVTGPVDEEGRLYRLPPS